MIREKPNYYQPTMMDFYNYLEDRAHILLVQFMTSPTSSKKRSFLLSADTESGAKRKATNWGYDLIRLHPFHGSSKVYKRVNQRWIQLPWDTPTCKSCGTVNKLGELCEECAIGNNPFVTSKYSEGARGPY